MNLVKEILHKKMSDEEFSSYELRVKAVKQYRKEKRFREYFDGEKLAAGIMSLLDSPLNTDDVTTLFVLRMAKNILTSSLSLSSEYFG